MTKDQLQRLYPNASKTFLQLNADLGSCAPPERERDSKPALVKDAPLECRNARGLVVVVSIIAFRKRLLDTDNSIAGGTKALRDAIARSLGVDDADPRIRWEYGQLRSEGEQGVIVKISTI